MPLNQSLRLIEEKWHNSSGVLYFHAYQTETVTNENVLSVKLPGAEVDRMHRRKAVSRRFLQ